MSGFTFSNLHRTLEELLLQLKENHVSNLEILPGNIEVSKNKAFGQYRYEGRHIHRAIELIHSYGIDIECITMPGAFDLEFANNISEYSASLEFAVEVAKEAGAKIVNHYCYYLCPNQKPDLHKLEKCWKPAILKAEELGIILTLENEPIDAGGTPEGMLRLLGAFNSPVFRTNFDATNYYQGSSEAFPYGYELLKKYISYVHIKNGCIYNSNAGHKEVFRGKAFFGANTGKDIYYPKVSEGAVNNDGLLLQLIKDNYSGCCTLEPHTKTFESAVQYFREEVLYLRNRKYFA